MFEVLELQYGRRRDMATSSFLTLFLITPEFLVERLFLEVRAELDGQGDPVMRRRRPKPIVRFVLTPRKAHHAPNQRPMP